MIPFNEVAVMDRNAEFRGVPPLNLMENAGWALAQEIQKRFEEHHIVFYCGTGNNGGDGFVAARYLSGWLGSDSVTVYMPKGSKDIPSRISRINFDKLTCKVVEDEPDIDDRKKLLVDCLLGTGIFGDIREPYRSTIMNINSSEDPVLSVDLPSGLGADIPIVPDITVTFHDVKEGMNEKNCGEIIIRDIGVPEKAITHTGPGEFTLYPIPSRDSHKGDNGKLLIIGGGPYTGAPALSAYGALRTGADLVLIAVPSEIAGIVSGYSPHFMIRPLKGDRLETDHIEELLEMCKDHDAVLLGPGIGSDPSTLDAAFQLAKRCPIPMVIDADALKALKGREVDFGGKVVLTPHLGELKAMGSSPEEIHDHALDMNATILLKGPVDVITDGTRKKYNEHGSPAMSVGGTGDTLAGVVGALMSKGLKPFDAARLGAYISGIAGELAFGKKSWGMLPKDISESIPDVFTLLEDDEKLFYHDKISHSY